jgi:membrane associated rhomboid family serine protease
MVITTIVIAVTVFLSILGFYNQEIFNRCKFNAYDVRHANQWYRFFTYGFFHAGWFHLLVNMFVLYSFGLVVEKAFLYYFHSRYILYYLLLYVGALILSILPSYGKHRNNVFYNAIGASGAVAAIVFASILLEPDQKVYLFLIPFGIPAPVFGVLYLAYEFYMSKRGKDNIGHDAHFWGAIFGIVFTLANKPVIFTAFLQQLGWM